VDIARSLDVPNLMLALNKVLPKYSFDQIRREVEGMYQAPVAGVLPLSEDLVDLGSADIFTLRYPTHSWSQAMNEIAQEVLAIE
jgi:MinD-like ATPase involved in chromosome partitioning or flagellar assembly